MKYGKKPRHSLFRTILFTAAEFLILLVLAWYVVPRITESTADRPGESGALLPESSLPLFSSPRCIKNPDSIPDYSGEDYIVLNGNIPDFSEDDFAEVRGEAFAGQDSLGRCGASAAILTGSMMPEGERGEIKDIHPSGWHTARYPGLIEDEFLYHRCHLIAYAMTGQNDNPDNLITGTGYFNTEGMLPFEKKVLRYLDTHESGHVLYRVTPFFKGSELVARGVEMEAFSLEDRGEGVRFHVFVYNHQPGIEIDYRTGESRIAVSFQSN